MIMSPRIIKTCRLTLFVSLSLQGALLLVALASRYQAWLFDYDGDRFSVAIKNGILFYSYSAPVTGQKNTYMWQRGTPSPLSLLFLLLLVPIAVSGLLACKRGPPNRCRKCGYDVRTTTASRCPECGCPLDERRWKDRAAHMWPWSRRARAYVGIGIVVLLEALIVNTLTTHEITVKNDAGEPIWYISVDVDVNPTYSKQFTLRNMPPGREYSWTFRSLFYDGKVLVQGQIDESRSINGASRNITGKAYAGANRIVIQEGGGVQVIRE